MSKYLDFIVDKALLLFSLVSLATSILVVGLLGVESFEFFKEISFTDFLFGTEWEPLIEPQSFGVLPLVSGTLYIVFGAILLALPAGLMIAVFLTEFASQKTRAILKPILEILAGIPTVVYGYFALSFVTPLIQELFPQTNVFNATSGAIVVGIMILPMVSSICDDALSSLPNSVREAGYALGGTSNEVVLQVLIPSASTHIWSAVILAISRAIGETMAVTLAAGSTPSLLGSPLDSIQTMTSYIVQVSLGDVEQGGVAYQTSFAVAGLLFLMTLVMNVIGHKLARRIQKRNS
ncbi:MAG: phosphate ABC transporter permease subunit PstC [Bdellovibrionales bacterium]